MTNEHLLEIIRADIGKFEIGEFETSQRFRIKIEQPAILAPFAYRVSFWGIEGRKEVHTIEQSEVKSAGLYI